jgi:cytochrome c oxidase assembly protein subunit 15
MEQQSNKAIVRWLYVGIFMILVQVLIGGITRLTGSGLSITEWKPIMGAIPPLHEAEWQLAFDKYKSIPQFEHINSHFELSDFKWIFFWEWLHRNWARLIGLVFAIPFLVFLIRKMIHKEMILPLIVLFLLGGLQGLIGWIMVLSGLGAEDVYVSHIRLAIHFVAAMGLLWYTLWFALKLRTSDTNQNPHPALHRLGAWILGLIILQMFYGGFMAGIHAALSAATWPTINGMWIPSGMLQGNVLDDATHNPITIQFIHRGLAYLLAILVVVWYWKSRPYPKLRKFGSWAVLLVFVQIVLGVLTVLNSKIKIPLGYALAHQFVGMLLLMSMIVAHYRTKSHA